MNKAPVLSLLRCYSTIFNNTRQDYLNKHMSKDGIDHGGHTMEAATAEACKAVAENQRDADHKHYQGIIREIFEELFPPKIYPRHLEYWAGQISKEQGYDSQLTNFLARLSTNWQSLKSKYQEDK